MGDTGLAPSLQGVLRIPFSILSPLPFLLTVLLVARPAVGRPDATPTPFLGIDLPHGSIQFFGSTFGDSSSSRQHPPPPFQPRTDWKPIITAAKKSGPPQPRSHVNGEQFNYQPHHHHEHQKPLAPPLSHYTPPTSAASNSGSGSYLSFVNFNHPHGSYSVTTPAPSAYRSAGTAYTTPGGYPAHHYPSSQSYPTQHPRIIIDSSVVDTHESDFLTAPEEGVAQYQPSNPTVPTPSAVAADENVDEPAAPSFHLDPITIAPFSFSVFNDNYSFPSFNVFEPAAAADASSDDSIADASNYENSIPVISLENHHRPTNDVEHNVHLTVTQLYDDLSESGDGLTTQKPNFNDLYTVSEAGLGDEVGVALLDFIEDNEVVEDADVSSSEERRTTLEDVLFDNSTYEQFSQSRKELDEFWSILNEENEYLNSLSDEQATPGAPRHARKIDAPKRSKNLSGLIQKALKLVRRVEEIGERKRTIESVRSTEPSNLLATRASTEALEEIKEFKEDQRFNELRSLIQNQNSLSSLIKTETSSLRDLLKNREEGDLKEEPKSSLSKSTNKNMLQALEKLNSISSLLLRDNGETRSTVREIPAEIRNILNSEMTDLRDILDSQNQNVAQQLEKVLRFDESRSSIGSDTEVVILRALAKLNQISGLLLKEQEKTEKQTDKALRALPALAQFIQAETAEIKDLIASQETNNNDEEAQRQLLQLRQSVSQSLSNDKLITRAIIKLNDITQLLLKDVNYTTTAVTNKLPAALTALITSETSQIRDMLDTQNLAIVEILKESKSLEQAEKALEEVTPSESDRSSPSKSLKQKFLEVLSPIFKQSGTDNKQKILQDEDEIDSLIRRLEPLIEEREREREDDAVRENAEQDTTNSAVESAALEGQKSIVQALLKLTNITRTLLEDKENEKRREDLEVQLLLEEEREREVQEDRDRRDDRLDDRLDDRRDNRRDNLRDDRIDDRRDGRRESSRRPAPRRFRNEYDDFDDYDGSRRGSVAYEDDFDYYDSFRRDNRRRPNTLIERVAYSSGPRNPKIEGNQVLFEQFVKLAIERQRWENAAKVHDLIANTVTTTPGPDDEEYYDYPEEELAEDLDSIEVKRNKGSSSREQERKFARPSGRKSTRPTSRNEDDRRLLVSEGGRQQSSKQFRSKDGRRFNRPRVQEFDDLEEYEYEESIQPQRQSKPRPRPKPTRRTTTELPEYYADEYLDYEYEDSVEYPEKVEEERRPSVEQRRPSVDQRRPVVEDIRQNTDRRLQEERRRPVENRRPSVKERRPPVENRRPPSADSRRPSTEDRRPPVEDRRPLVEDRRPPVEDRRPPVENRRPPVEDRRPLVEDEPPVTNRPEDKRQSISDLLPRRQNVENVKQIAKDTLSVDAQKERLRDILKPPGSRPSILASARGNKKSDGDSKEVEDRLEEAKTSFSQNSARNSLSRDSQSSISRIPPNQGRIGLPGRGRPGRPQTEERPVTPSKTVDEDPLTHLQNLVKKSKGDSNQQNEISKPKDVSDEKEISNVVTAKSITSSRSSSSSSISSSIKSTSSAGSRSSSDREASDKAKRVFADLLKTSESSTRATPPRGPSAGPSSVRPAVPAVPSTTPRSIGPPTRRTGPGRGGVRRKGQRRKGIRKPGTRGSGRNAAKPSASPPVSIKATPSSSSSSPRKLDKPRFKFEPRPQPTQGSRRPGQDSSSAEQVRSSGGRPSLPARRPSSPTTTNPPPPPRQLIIEEVTGRPPRLLNSPAPPTLINNNINKNDDTKVEKSQRLTSAERSKAKAERNSLLKLLSNKNGRRPLFKSKPRPTPTTSTPTRQPTGNSGSTSSMSPLENLFSIAKKTTEQPKAEVKKSDNKKAAAKGGNSGERKTGIRRKVKGKKQRPTTSPTLQDLSPQERLVNKVMETLNQNKDTASAEQRRSSASAQVAGSKKVVVPAGRRVGGGSSGGGGGISREGGDGRKKKIIFRKKKTQRISRSRTGRTLSHDEAAEASRLKHVKVRVRRPHPEVDIGPIEPVRY